MQELALEAQEYTRNASMPVFNNCKKNFFLPLRQPEER